MRPLPVTELSIVHYVSVQRPMIPSDRDRHFRFGKIGVVSHDSIASRSANYPPALSCLFVPRTGGLEWHLSSYIHDDGLSESCEREALRIQNT